MPGGAAQPSAARVHAALVGPLSETTGPRTSSVEGSVNQFLKSKAELVPIVRLGLRKDDRDDVLVPIDPAQCPGPLGHLTPGSSRPLDQFLSFSVQRSNVFLRFEQPSLAIIDRKRDTGNRRRTGRRRLLDLGLDDPIGDQAVEKKVGELRPQVSSNPPRNTLVNTIRVPFLEKLWRVVMARSEFFLKTGLQTAVSTQRIV